ncbi:TonB-dependent receptor [Parasphingorhabdus sp.]|uniref:TonB-dependent receptor n=1 Tax=Parasphingorhabdus sp. TaxID=2709688 RepID=UPI002F955567
MKSRLLCGAMAIGWAVTMSAGALAQTGNSSDAAVEAAADQNDNVIVVTAQLREQNILDVPQAVQAIGATELKNSGVESLADVIAMIPSATTGSTISAGSNTFQIRGVAAAETDGDSTVGFYLDNFAFSLPGRPYAPSVDFYDMERVEVLRGPSGTLYGLGSLGGTIKILTAQPDLVDAQLSTRISANITDGGEPGAAADMMVNVPLIEDRLALRGVVSYQMIGGYADVLPTGKRNGNDANNFTGRVKLLAVPTDTLRVTLSAWHNRSNQDFSNRITFVDPPVLDQTFGVADSKYTLLSGDVELDLNFATLSSTTGYIKNTVIVNNGGFIPGIGDFAAFWPLRTKNFSQDFRLTSQGNGSLQWLIGAFYQNGETKGGQSVSLYDFPVNDQMGLGTFNDNRLKSEAFAIYGEGTYSFFDDVVDLTVGGRYYREKRRFDENSSLTFLEDDVVIPTIGTDRATNDTINPRFNIAIHPSGNGMVYFEVAKGFRSGAITSSSIIAAANSALGTDFSNSSPPDTLWNYEAGLRWSFLNDDLNASLSVYQFDWADAQIELSPTLQSIVVPVGDVRGRGIDAEINWRTPLDGLRLQVSGNTNETELRDVIPEVAAALPWVSNGRQLPGTAKHTLSVSGSYVMPVGEWDLGVHGRYSYRSRQQSIFDGRYAPWSGLGSMRVTLSRDDLEVALFSDNIGNSGRPISVPGGQNQIPYPRTIGISFEKKF